jgi:hypothetical protein
MAVTRHFATGCDMYAFPTTKAQATALGFKLDRKTGDAQVRLVFGYEGIGGDVQLFVERRTGTGKKDWAIASDKLEGDVVRAKLGRLEELQAPDAEEAAGVLDSLMDGEEERQQYEEAEAALETPAPTPPPKPAPAAAKKKKKR